MPKWSQDPCTRDNVSKVKKKRKRYIKSSLYPSKSTLPLTKISYTNPPPTSMTTFISKTTSHFCHQWQRVRVSSRHFISTGRDSISILIIIIVVGVIIILGCLGRRGGRLYKATKVSLPSSNTTNMGVHLIHLSRECIKASIHALKLRHDRIKGHNSHKRRRSRGGWSFWPGSPRTKLRFALFNGSSIYSTHNVEMVGQGKREQKNGIKSSW